MGGVALAPIEDVVGGGGGEVALRATTTDHPPCYASFGSAHEEA